jgi:hypothetical protein
MSFAAASLAGLIGGSPFIGWVVLLNGVEDLSEARLALYQGTALQLAEKICTGHESSTSGAKAQRISNRLRPD